MKPTSVEANHRLTPWPAFVPEPLMTGALAVTLLETVDALTGFSPLLNRNS